MARHLLIKNGLGVQTFLLGYPGMYPSLQKSRELWQNEAKKNWEDQTLFSFFFFFNKQKEIFSPLAAEGKFDYQST